MNPYLANDANVSDDAVFSDNVIRERVYAIVAEHAKLEASLLKPESTLKDLGIASLTAMEVLFDIEERFDIDFPDHGPEFDGDTLQKLLDAVRRGLDAKNAKSPKKAGAA